MKATGVMAAKKERDAPSKIPKKPMGQAVKSSYLAIGYRI